MSTSLEAGTSRRQLLRYGAARALTVTGIATVGLAGCSGGDPTIKSSAPPPTPPPPFPGLSTGLEAEALALAWCDEMLTKPLQLSTTQLATIAVLRQFHQRRYEVIGSTMPIQRALSNTSIAPTPTPTGRAVTVPTVPKDALREFSVTLAATAGSHDRAANGQSGQVALFWASCAAGASQSAVWALRTTALSAVPPESSHAPYTPPTAVVAAQALLTQLHQALFGIQVALGGLPDAGAIPYQQRLVRIRNQRNQLTAWLRDQQADVPVAQPEYAVTSAATPAAALALIVGVETALLPWLGDWIAAAPQEQVRSAMAGLIDAATNCASAGGAPQRWPGWRD